MLSSSICKASDFIEPWYSNWSERLGEQSVQRKVWEWCVQSQVLHERCLLRPGARGLGFAVGQEPLPSLFASMGATIDATDIGVGGTADFWSQAGQHAANLDALYKPALIDRDAFEQRVRFFPADMNELSSLPDATYDFIWSSCAMEHLGTLDHGLAFVVNAMRLLKVGGVACHTTEFNVADQVDTVHEGVNVIYRESDLRRLDGMLRKKFCCLEKIDFDVGCDRDDVLFDSPPWGHRGHKHIKLLLDGFICTSAVLICRRYA